MAVSGTKTFELDVAEYVEEAFERCGLELRTGYDLKSANRSSEPHAGRVGQQRTQPMDRCPEGNPYGCRYG
jgi:hypothetical protein